MNAHEKFINSPEFKMLDRELQYRYNERCGIMAEKLAYVPDEIHNQAYKEMKEYDNSRDN